MLFWCQNYTAQPGLQRQREIKLLFIKGHKQVHNIHLSKLEQV